MWRFRRRGVAYQLGFSCEDLGFLWEDLNAHCGIFVGAFIVVVSTLHPNPNGLGVIYTLYNR